MNMSGLEKTRELLREIDLRFAGLAMRPEAAMNPGERKHGDEGVAQVVSSLNQAQREHLIEAMAEVVRLLHASAVRVELEAPESEDAQWCMQSYFRELARRFDAGFDPARSNPADAETMRPPLGAFVIARLDARPIGCGALRVKEPGLAEIKRMWVSDEARRLGVGRRIIEALEAQARAFAIGTLRLETNRNLTEAQALYRSSGYREVPAFNDEPYAHHWFEKALC